MIEVINLSKDYGGHRVVDCLNFTVETGLVYGFLGPNGAGKSTTMNMITGCLAPTEGRVLIDGIDIGENPIEAKRKIGYLPEIPPVYPDLSPTEYLLFVAEAKGVRGDERFRQVFQVIEEAGLSEMKDRLIKNLSKGYRQRVGIAAAMLGNPELIILDEPTVGLDPRQIIEMRNLIRKLGETRTVILSSHILSEISAVCDRVMIIRRGKLVANDTLENIRLANAPDNRMILTARGDEGAIRQVIENLPDLSSFEIQPTDNPGEFHAVIDAPAGVELGERIFSDMAKAGVMLSRLMKSEPSLEEIFLNLTEGGEPADEDDSRSDGDNGNDGCGNPDLDISVLPEENNGTGFDRLHEEA